MSRIVVLCEADQSQIFEQLDIFYDILESRILASFDSVEEEAKELEVNRLKELNENFNPDYMDGYTMHEDAYSKGGEYYAMHTQMEQSLLNMSTVWLYHLFEQQLFLISKKIIYDFNHTRKDAMQKIKNCLDSKNVELESWNKIKELKFVANTIKHAEGNSLEVLRKLRPDLFIKSFGTVVSEVSIPLFKNEIEISREDLKTYYDEIVHFWNDFFEKIKIMERITKC